MSLFLVFFATYAAADAADLPIRFSKHAAERLEERHILRMWAEQVVRMPEWTEPDPQHKPSVHLAFGHIAAANGMVLRVIYADVPGAELVITEYFDRGAERRHRDN